jgi:uncharacterized membrane protein
MDLGIIWAIILSMLPVTELRIGLPKAIIYANQHNIPIVLIFSLIVMANILAIFLAFFFLEKFHPLFLKLKGYKRFFDRYVEKFQGKVDKFEKKYSAIGFLALSLFVAIPLPATGAWSGVLISWLLDLDRKKSILAISLGVVIAGVLVLLGTLGFLTLFS